MSGIPVPVYQVQPGKVLYPSDDYDVQRVNSGRLKIFRLIIHDPSNNSLPYILQMGSEVQTIINIPTAHRLLKIGWVHTTSTPSTGSSDSLSYYIAQRTFGAGVLPVQFDAYSGTASNHYVELESFGYEEPPREYLISTNTTNTDRVYLFLDLQIIGEDV